MQESENYLDCVYDGDVIHEVEWKGNVIKMPFLIFKEKGLDPLAEGVVSYPKDSKQTATLPNFVVWVLDHLVGSHMIVMMNLSLEEQIEYDAGIKWLELNFPGTLETLF